MPDDDPERYLTEAARRRLLQAFAEQERLLCEAEATIQSRKLTGDEAACERNHAALARARAVLRVAFEEYRAAGLSQHELIEVMAGYIESAWLSLNLDGAQKHLLAAELYVLPETHERRLARVETCCRALNMKRDEFIRDVLHISSVKYYRWREFPTSVPDGDEINRRIDELKLLRIY